MRRRGRCCRGQPAAGVVSGEAGYYYILQERESGKIKPLREDRHASERKMLPGAARRRRSIRRSRILFYTLEYYTCFAGIVNM